MERLVRKYEQSFRRAKEELNTWKGLQARLVTQFGNATAILERLPVLLNPSNYGVLVDKSMVLTRDLPAVQVESLELTFKGMSETLEDLKKVSNSLEKIWRDGQQLLKTERPQPTAQQFQRRVGSRPSIQDCVDGLYSLYEMHRDEHKLKIAIVSALTYDTKPEDATLLKTMLGDEPNIPSHEVQHIFDLISVG